MKLSALQLLPQEIWSDVLLHSIDATHYYSEYFFPLIIPYSRITAYGKPFILSEWKQLRLVCKAFYMILISHPVISQLNLCYFLNPEQYLKHYFRSWLETGNFSYAVIQMPHRNCLKKTATYSPTMQAKIRMIKLLQELPKKSSAKSVFYTVRSYLIATHKTRLASQLARKEMVLVTTKRKRDELQQKVIQFETKKLELEQLLLQIEYPPDFNF